MLSFTTSPCMASRRLSSASYISFSTSSVGAHRHVVLELLVPDRDLVLHARALRLFEGRQVVGFLEELVLPVDFHPHVAGKAQEVASGRCLWVAVHLPDLVANLIDENRGRVVALLGLHG